MRYSPRQREAVRVTETSCGYYRPRARRRRRVWEGSKSAHHRRPVPRPCDGRRRVHRDHQEHVDQDVAPLRVSVGRAFLRMIGASHNAKYSIFAIGRRPTPGSSVLSEEGKQFAARHGDPRAIDRQRAMLFESGGLKKLEGSMVARVRVDPRIRSSRREHDRPEPDCSRARPASPSRQRRLDHRRTVTLYAYDRAQTTDAPTTLRRTKTPIPRSRPTRAANRTSSSNGRVKPVATLDVLVQEGAVGDTSSSKTQQRPPGAALSA